MRTNIILNDLLVQKAFKYSEAKTKKQLVEIALMEFVENHQKLDLRDLKGKIAYRSDYNYKELR